MATRISTSLRVLLAISPLAVSAKVCGWSPSTHVHPWGGPSCPLPIDDRVGSDPATWSPWTHRPFCANSSLCAFTNAYIPRDRGISIIATPETVAANSGLLGLHFDAPYLDSSQVFDSPPYEVRDIPGKGRGAVATRKIDRGKAIMTDHALIMAPYKYFLDLTDHQIQRLLTRAAAQLPHPEAVMTLGRSYMYPHAAVQDIVLTNDFIVKMNGDEYRALFPELSRANHACNPNAFVRFTEQALAMTMWALRDIEEGEEITISYIEAGLPYNERQHELQTRWNFQCECHLCSAPESERNRSDARRNKIWRLVTETGRHMQLEEFDWAIDASLEAIELAEEEGMHLTVRKYWETLAKIYYAAGDPANALKYARLALEQLRSYGLPSAEEAERIASIDQAVMEMEKFVGAR